MIYKVLEMNNSTTATGKSMKRLKLEGEYGTYTLNIFSDFPHYGEIAIGSTIDGEIRKNNKGYDNLYSNEIKRSYGASRPPQRDISKDVAEAQKRTTESVNHAQDRTERSIKISSTMNKAVEIAVALTPEQWQSTTIQEEIRFWRGWLWNEWDNLKDIPPFND